MGGPEKPFSCSESGCGASFTNADRLAVHAKKHDMVLDMTLGNKSGVYVDQTPTPTRFIRNCEEVGLFQDLQNVNPFDETFKRAMESRSEPSHLILDDHLSTVSNDDTLHTPLIFPHLPDDNTVTIFSSDEVQRQTLRMSSDEGSNQLSVVKCIDDEPCKRLKRKSESTGSKSNKLVRQNPVDIADITFESEKISTESCKSENNHSLQIPVISISEPSDYKGIKENLLRNDALLTPDRSNSRESVKLISQKSIYKELDKLTNCSPCNVDLSISIDDIPALHMGSNDSNSVIRETNNTTRKPKLSLSIDSATAKRNAYKMSKHNDTDSQSREIPIIENLGTQPMTDSTGKGVYELLLKWPDGQKIYLKEVYREKEAADKEANSKALKRKLKEVIQNKEKKTINKNVQTQPVIIPENCIIIPQMSQISPVIMQNKITPQPVIITPSQGKLQTSHILSLPPIAPNPEVSYKLPVIQSSRKPPMILPCPLDKESVIKDTKSYSYPKVAPEPSKSNSRTVETAAASDTTSQNNKTDVQQRNRAAVHRYRMRRNAMVTTLQQNHKKLTDDYKTLNNKFQEAMLEIKRLRTILSEHSDCCMRK